MISGVYFHLIICNLNAGPGVYLVANPLRYRVDYNYGHYPLFLYRLVTIMNASGYLKKEMRNAAVPSWHPLIDMHWAWHIHPLDILPHTYPRVHSARNYGGIPAFATGQIENIDNNQLG